MKFTTKLTLLVTGVVIFFALFVSYTVNISNVKSLEHEIRVRLEDTAFNIMDKIDNL